MLQVILDTNFMLLPLQEKVDIYEKMFEWINGPFVLIVLEPCIHELELLSSTAADLAKQKVKIVPGTGNADDFIADYSKDKKVLVCTQDKVLKARLKKLGISVAMYGNGKLRGI